MRRCAAATAARPELRGPRDALGRLGRAVVRRLLATVADRRPGGVTVTADDRRDLSRSLSAVAAILDAHGFPLAGVVRQGAIELATHVCIAGEVEDGGCAECGAPVEQPDRGRRRTYCFDCRPRRAAA